MPRGIEVLLRKAAVDAEFRDALTSDFEAAANSIALDSSGQHVITGDLNGRLRVKPVAGANRSGTFNSNPGGSGTPSGSHSRPLARATARGPVAAR